MKVISTSFMFYCNIPHRRMKPSSKNLIPENFSWPACGLNFTFLMKCYLFLAKLSHSPARVAGF